MTNMNSGYTGYSMSNRAVSAYENGEMPLSKWTKSEIMRCVNECVDKYNLSVDLINKLTVKQLKDLFIYISSWHHTSSYCNRTNFYEFREDKLSELTNEKVQKMINERKKVKKQELEIEKWECEYLEWSGTRKHPKATKCKAVGEIKGNWFYLADGSKKSINAKGFMQLRKVN